MPGSTVQIYLDLDEGLFFARINGQELMIPFAEKSICEKEYVFHVQTLNFREKVQIDNPEVQEQPQNYPELPLQIPAEIQV
jgi:hypothetical protein